MIHIYSPDLEDARDLDTISTEELKLVLGLMIKQRYKLTLKYGDTLPDTYADEAENLLGQAIEIQCLSEELKRREDSFKTELIKELEEMNIRVNLNCE